MKLSNACAEMFSPVFGVPGFTSDFQRKPALFCLETFLVGTETLKWVTSLGLCLNAGLKWNKTGAHGGECSVLCVGSSAILDRC